MKRAIRRKHFFRLRVKREDYWNKRYYTVASCSCSMCGNVRRSGWEEPKTRQEQKNELAFKEWLNA